MEEGFRINFGGLEEESQKEQKYLHIKLNLLNKFNKRNGN